MLSTLAISSVCNKHLSILQGNDAKLTASGIFPVVGIRLAIAWFLLRQTIHNRTCSPIATVVATTWGPTAVTPAPAPPTHVRRHLFHAWHICALGRHLHANLASAGLLNHEQAHDICSDTAIRREA